MYSGEQFFFQSSYKLLCSPAPGPGSVVETCRAGGGLRFVPYRTFTVAATYIVSVKWPIARRGCCDSDVLSYVNALDIDNGDGAAEATSDEKGAL